MSLQIGTTDGYAKNVYLIIANVHKGSEKKSGNTGGGSGSDRQKGFAYD
jgi:hypothetical protein